MKNYYSILNVSQKDSSEKIKKQYKKLSLQYHPDKIKNKNKSVETIQKYNLINEAYDTLKDDYKRGRYDVEYEKNFSFKNMFQNFTNTNFFNFQPNSVVNQKPTKNSYMKSHYVQSVQKNGETFIKEKIVEKDSKNGKINEKRNYRKIDRNGKEIKLLK